MRSGVPAVMPTERSEKAAGTSDVGLMHLCRLKPDLRISEVRGGVCAKVDGR